MDRPDQATIQAGFAVEFGKAPIPQLRLLKAILPSVGLGIIGLPILATATEGSGSGISALHTKFAGTRKIVAVFCPSVNGDYVNERCCAVIPCATSEFAISRIYVFKTGREIQSACLSVASLMTAKQRRCKEFLHPTTQ